MNEKTEEKFSLKMQLVKIVTAFLFMLFSIFTTSYANAAQFKINDLIFDNSGSIILIKSTGAAAGDTESPPVAITKGVLSNPNRVFFDISNSVLTVPQRSWVMKNSAIEEVKISQFSLNPEVVRLVVKCGAVSPANFEIVQNKNQLVLKYSNDIAQSTQFETVYKNFEDKVFPNPNFIFENTKPEIVPDVPKVPDDPSKGNVTIGETNLSRVFDKNVISTLEKSYKLNSKFYATKVVTAGNGLMLTGLGVINLKPAIILDNPARLVFDIQNAVLAPGLKNRVFGLTQPQPAPQASPGQPAEQRDILRLGQFEKNIVRIVIEGSGAKEYRAVISPDLQNLFIAKKPAILNTKLTQNLARTEFYNVQNLDPTLDLLTMNFSSPIAFSIFEENKQLHFDMQNVMDFNQVSYVEMLKNPKFANVKATKIASEKTRLSFPLKENTGINAQISNDGKIFRIYFKENALSGEQGSPLIQKPIDDGQGEKPKIELPKFRPSIITNYYKIVIDPGHGGSDTGAIRENVNEKDINLPVAKMVRDNLIKEKVNVEMTMETDKTVSLQQRVEFSNSINPDLYISIHANSSMKEDIIGIETHWYREESLELAKKVHAAMASDKNLKKWETRDRGLFKSQFYVINHTTTPAILLELGFMSNSAELKNLTDKKRQEEIARAISEGIMDYLKTRNKK